MEFGVPLGLENIPQKCVGCEKHFVPINEEAEGTHFEAPPELRCGACQVAYRLRGGNKSKHLTWQEYVLCMRASIQEEIEDMKWKGIPSIIRQRKLEEMLLAMYQ
jgi:hypothetical protein